MNEIYLNTLAAGIYSFDTGQSDDLYDIGNQCPFVGGNAVYKARGLYYLVANEDFDDHALCNVEPRFSDSTGGFTEISLNLYPNPTDKEFSIAYVFNQETNGEIIFTDALEREISSQSFNGQHGHIRFDSSTLPAGIYFTKIYANGRVLRFD
ncbi:MAG: T9SS type A sorting domain-containing protein, partial [Chitinophagales bacterium]